MKAKKEERNQEWLEKNNQLIYVDPQIAAAIRNSTFTSNQRGVTAHLMKVSRHTTIYVVPQTNIFVQFSQIPRKDGQTFRSRLTRELQHRRNRERET